MKVRMLIEVLRECNMEADVKVFDDGTFVEAFAVCEDSTGTTVTIIDENVHSNLLDMNEEDFEGEIH